MLSKYSGTERYLIVAGWVEACLEEATLVDERSKLGLIIQTSL